MRKIPGDGNLIIKEKWKLVAVCFFSAHTITADFTQLINDEVSRNKNDVYCGHWTSRSLLTLFTSRKEINGIEFLKLFRY